MHVMDQDIGGSSCETETDVIRFAVYYSQHNTVPIIHHHEAHQQRKAKVGKQCAGSVFVGAKDRVGAKKEIQEQLLDVTSRRV